MAYQHIEIPSTGEKISANAEFEATHGTAPNYAGQDKVNPGSLDLVGRDDAAPSR